MLEVTKGLDVLTDVMFAWMQPYMTNIFTMTVVMYWTAFLYHFLLASEITMLGTQQKQLHSPHPGTQTVMG